MRSRALVSCVAVHFNTRFSPYFLEHAKDLWYCKGCAKKISRVCATKSAHINAPAPVHIPYFFLQAIVLAYVDKNVLMHPVRMDPTGN